jgi:cadmium resistance protein CadD (predicted permease)
VRDVAVTVVVAAAAFYGTMIDNAIALVAHLALGEARHHTRACIGQFVGVLCVIVVAIGVAVALQPISTRWIGVLAVLPLALAGHAWIHRHDKNRTLGKGAIASFVTTVAIGGDNVAVWIPLLRVLGVARGALAVGVFVVGDLTLIFGARAIATHPRVITVSTSIAPRATPVLFVALAVLVLWQCGLL